MKNKSRIVVGIRKPEKLQTTKQSSDGNEKKVSEAARKAKQASRAGRELLKELLRNVEGIDLSEEEDPIGKETDGKPFLKNHKEIFFNISHSGEYIACAVGKVPVGIDIQYHKNTNIDKLAKKVLSKSEWARFEEAGCMANVFYDFWAKKESFLKFTGEGIQRDLKKLDYENGQFYKLNFREDYSGMICVPKGWEGEIVLSTDRRT